MTEQPRKKTLAERLNGGINGITWRNLGTMLALVAAFSGWAYQLGVTREQVNMNRTMVQENRQDIRELRGLATSLAELRVEIRGLRVELQEVKAELREHDQR